MKREQTSASSPDSTPIAIEIEEPTFLTEQEMRVDPLNPMVRLPRQLLGFIDWHLIDLELFWTELEKDKESQKCVCDFLERVCHAFQDECL